MMNIFIRSSDFDRWLEALKDDKGKARISSRLRSAMFGNFGDCQPVGEGVSEIRVHVGPGYRVYSFGKEPRSMSCWQAAANLHRQEISLALGGWRAN